LDPFHFLPGFTQDFYTGVAVTRGECLNIVTFQVQTSNEIVGSFISDYLSKLYL